MKPIKTGEVAPNVYAVSNRQVNFYLVGIDQKYIAVDAGASAGVSRRELEKLRINPEDVLSVFLTHTDSDRTGESGCFRRRRCIFQGGKSG